MSKAGYRTESRTVDLSTREVHLAIKLEEMVRNGRVFIFLVGPPEGRSRVHVDGALIGELPVQASLTEGFHEFRVTRADGSSVSQRHYIDFGASDRVTLNLKLP